MAYCFDCFREMDRDTGPCPYCGYDPAEDEGKYPLALPHGSILAGQYITGRVLGQGGFGITYMAYDVRLDQKVAIKEYMPQGMAFRETGSPQMTVYSGQYQEDYSYGKELFLTEARTLAKFQGNPNIVGVRMFFEENGTAYFVMDYVQGINLARYIANHGGRLPWAAALKLLEPVMDALNAVHREGIIHRDVSPDNIFITADGRVKLLDFGAARYSLGDKSQSLDLILKPGYAPIEQYYRRGKQGPYTDVYALSACMYAAITGQIPPESAERTYNDSLRPPSALGVSLPAGGEQALLRGLAVQPEGRYQTMGEFKEALTAPATSTPPPPPPRPTKELKRYFLLSLLLLLAGPVIAVASTLTLAGRGIAYPVYITLFCAGFLLPPAVTLLLARRLGMDGAGWKRLGVSALPFLAGIVFALAAPYSPNSADTSWLGALAGAWLIFLSGFASTASSIPGHPRRGTVPRKTGKLLVIGLLFFGYSVISFFASLF